MSRVGLLVEGGIDEEILSVVLAQLLKTFRRWRSQQNVFMFYLFPPNGYSEIPKNLRTLVNLYQDPSERARIGCDVFVIVHDMKNTEEVQREIRRILRDNQTFPAVYGIAIQELEAWILADIENVNRMVFRVEPTPRLPRAPERDSDPKRTLVELFIRPSKEAEFDGWNLECARRVAPHIRPEQVIARCPRGFGRFVGILRVRMTRRR